MKQARSEPFAFDTKFIVRRVSDETILAALRKFRALNKGRKFSIARFDAWANRPCCSETVRARFGGWRNALRTVGINGVRPGSFDPAELMDILEQVWRDSGRPPTAQMLRFRGGVSVRPYHIRWGTLKNAREKLAAFHKGDITRDELLARALRPRHIISRSLRWKVLKRDRGRCTLCGRSPADSGVTIEIDHIIPASKGGKATMENLRALCRDCNRGKGANPG